MEPPPSMLEAYAAYGDYDTQAELTRGLVLDAARAIGRTVIPDGRGGEIDLEGPWQQVALLDAVSEALGDEITLDTPVEKLRSPADSRDVDLDPSWDADHIIVELNEQLIERNQLEPTFIKDYPESLKPRARPHRSIHSLQSYSAAQASISTRSRSRGRSSPARRSVTVP